MELIDLFEAYHTKYGIIPSRLIVENVLERSGNQVTKESLDTWYESPLVAKSLNARGIYLPTQLEHSTTGLTKRQLAVIAALNNTRDSRSDAKKIADYQVTPREFAGWSHNKRFAEALADSANNLAENAEADAHIGLLKRVKSGDMTAIKFYFEMTGKYNPAYENQVNLQTLMSSIIEAIQKHVRDPQTLQELAAELQLISVNYNVNPRHSARAVSVDKSNPKAIERRPYF